MSEYRAGFVGLVGLPNAGKSSLVNALVGEKVAIVTRKPQTTRQRVVGIQNLDQAQILWVDTPGVIEATSGLNKFLQEEAEAVIKESDVLIAVLNVDHPRFEDLEAITEKVKSAGKPWLILITKTDLSRASHRSEILKLKMADHQVPIVAGSALQNASEIKANLEKEIVPLLPVSPGPLYDPELYTTQTSRELVSEIIREVCFENLHEELPYSLAVQVKKFEEGDRLVKIYADLIVSKDNHRRILVGAGGAKIKDIGIASRRRIEKILGRKVYLELYVTVKKNWMQIESFMKELGYVVREA